MNRTLLLGFALLCTLLCGRAQTIQLSGVVQDSTTSRPLVGVIVLVSDKVKATIVAHTETAGDGSFALKAQLQDPAKYALKVSYFGYETQVFELGKPRYSIRLREKAIALRELVVKAQKITQSSDTTTYLVSGFAKESDRTLRDALERMPGINVSESGQISYNGQAINKFYIEGMDLLGGRYGLAVNNISHKHISKVQVLENHQPIKALEGQSKGMGTALNLSLKEDAKARWTGDVLAAGGFSPEDFLWEGELFASRFSKQGQALTTLKSNNSGKDITSEGKALTLEDLANMLLSENLEPRLKASLPKPPHLSEQASRLNQTHTLTASHLTQLTADAQLRTQVAYTDDINRAEQYSSSAYFLHGSTLERRFSQRGEVKDRVFDASLQATINGETLYLQEELSYSLQHRDFITDIGGDLQLSSLGRSTMHKLENRLRFTKRKGKNTYQLTSLTNYMHIPERLDISGDRLLGQSIAARVFYSNTQLNFVRNIGSWRLEMTADLFGRLYHFESDYRGGSLRYLNDLRTNHIGSRLSPELRYETSDLRLSIEFPLSLYRFFGSQGESRAYTKPRLYLRWMLHPRWTLWFNASLGSSYLGTSLLYDHPLMLDYQTLQAGLVDFSGRKTRQLGARLSYTKPSEMLFVHLSSQYSVDDIGRRALRQVEPSQTILSYLLGSNPRHRYYASGSIGKGLDLIGGSVELSSRYQRISSSLRQNSVDSRSSFGYWDAQLLIKSQALDWLDINYSVSYQHSFLQSDALKSSSGHLMQSAVLTLSPSKGLHLKLKTEHYLSTLPDKQYKHALLSSLDCVYRYKKCDIKLSASNLFNQSHYSYTLYSDLSSSYTEYRTRSRNLLLSLHWYF